MGASVVGVLAVHEAEVSLSVVVGVGEREFESLVAAVDVFLERRLVANFVSEEVGEPAGTEKAPAVVHDAQARVQIGVIAEPVFDEFFVPGKIIEDLDIGREANVGAGGFVALAALFLLELATNEIRLFELSVSHASDLEVRRQRIDRLCTNPVQTD